MPAWYHGQCNDAATVADVPLRKNELEKKQEGNDRNVTVAQSSLLDKVRNEQRKKDMAATFRAL